MKDQNNRPFSILFPYHEDTVYRQLTPAACHDLGLDTLCRTLTDDQKEQRLITDVLSNMTSDRRVAEYRSSVFADILRLPQLRKSMTGLFEKIEFIRDFGSMHRESDENLGLWRLLHRLDELNDYIKCVEAIREGLDGLDIRSDGLKGFKAYVDELYSEACFAEMKKDIADLKMKASDIKSVTLGVNVNERFEAVSMGLISVNSKPFRKSGIVSNFADAVASKNRIHDSTDWDGSMHYQYVDSETDQSTFEFFEKMVGLSSIQKAPFVDRRIVSTIVNAPEGDGVANSTFYLERVLNRILDSLVKKLRETLTKYANIAIVNISQLIPEFVYYIRFAEFIEKYRSMGFVFCEPSVAGEGDIPMKARGFYNLKLALGTADMSSIVCNDLDFDREHTVYILTGANRGGKTTVTQAVGLLFALAQGGISVPASSFEYIPADCIYTHFPADEDKTMDLGRLGEECVRFREIYTSCTGESLLLLNETFSTTSFEEGFYIAKDSVRALLKKQVRTIYNTHMHKLAADMDGTDGDGNGVCAASLIVRCDDGRRSFRLEKAPPEGMSYAGDIARKYGVTYDMLINGQEGAGDTAEMS